MARIVLTKGEQQVLRRCYPDQPWQLEQEFTEHGIQKLREYQHRLEQKAATLLGGSPGQSQILYDAEMLGRVTARYETRESSPPPSAGTPEKEMSQSGESS